MTKAKVIPKNAIFTVTSGEYSDYHTLTMCRALVQIDTEALQKEFLASHPEHKREYSMKESEVLNWMINEQNYAEEIEFFELHLGRYSTADFRLTFGSIKDPWWD